MNHKRIEKLAKIFDSKTNPTEIADILKDQDIRKEYFSLMFVKAKLGELPPKEFQIPFVPKMTIWKQAAPLIFLAASMLIVISSSVLYNFFGNNIESYSRVISSHGNCFQVYENNELIRYSSYQNSYCDIEINKYGKLSLRIFPNTEAKFSIKGNQLVISIYTGSILVTSSKREKNINIEVRANHLRAVLLGTSFYIKVTASEERLSLVEGSLMVRSNNQIESESKLIHAGDFILYNPSSTNSNSLNEGKLTGMEVEFIKNLARIEKSTSPNNKSSTELNLSILRNFEESNDYFNYPYVSLTETNGKKWEGYLIELADHYSLFVVGIGKIRIERSNVKTMETIRTY
ncbi:MAG: hypothetical protein SH817_03925 [Leptospira sp.]|nr:hypothetical protein [Leptospira sp.]